MLRARRACGLLRHHTIPCRSFGVASRALSRGFEAPAKDTPKPPGANSDLFLVSTLAHFHGREIDHEVGVLCATATRSVSIFKDLSTALLSMGGGEDSHYSHLGNATSEAAVDKLVTLAKKMGADAILGLRLEQSVSMNRLVVGCHFSVLAYGTAVKLKPASPQHQQQGKLR